MCWQPDWTAHNMCMARTMKAYYDAFWTCVNDYVDFGVEEAWGDAKIADEFCAETRKRVTALLKHLNGGRSESSVVDTLSSVSVDWDQMLGLDG
jgi:hypothetical protein